MSIHGRSAVLQQQQRIPRGIPAPRPLAPRPLALWWPLELISQLSQCPLDQVAAHWPLIAQALEQRGLNDRLVCAGVIGTIAIETASTFAPVREAYYLGDFDTAEAWRRANLRYYPYYGRGFVQLTWESNYQRASAVLGVDLVSEPDLALDPWLSAQLLALFIDEHGVAEAARRQDWRAVRYRVLGGYDGADRLERVATALLVEG